jgi:hypothetical protein
MKSRFAPFFFGAFSTVHTASVDAATSHSRFLEGLSGKRALLKASVFVSRNLEVASDEHLGRSRPARRQDFSGVGAKEGR